MSKTIVILGLLAFGLTGCDTANNMGDPNKDSYLRLIGNDDDQYGVDMVVDTVAGFEGHMFILGHTGSSTLGQQLYVVHTNPDGFVIWERTYGGIENEEARDIEILSNGDLAILGVVSDFSGNSDFKLLRISKEGVPRDSVTYGLPGFFEEAYSISETADSYFVTGYTNNTVAAGDPADALFVRYVKSNPPALYPDWDPSQGGDADFDVASKTLEVGSDFYVFGHSNRGEGDDLIADYNVFVWVLGSEGVPARVYLIGDSLIVGARPGFDEKVSSVATVPSSLGGGFAVSGYSTDPSTNMQRIFTMTIRGDLSGVPIDITTKDKRLLLPDDPRLDDDTRSSPTSSQGASVYVSGDGEFFVLGTEGMNGNENIYLKKLKGDLQDAWFAPSFFSFGGIDKDIPGAVAETADGHIMVVGTMYLGEPPNGQTKVLLMKLSPRGKLGE